MKAQLRQFAKNAVCGGKAVLASFLRVPSGDLRIHHGGGGASIGGPAVKLWRMQQYFPDHSLRYNLIYSVSSSVPPAECRIAKARGVKIVAHVNSVFHPLYRANYRRLNKPIKRVHDLADFVVFGSKHAQKEAQRLLGPVERPSSIVYNAVDLDHYKPVDRPPERFNVLVIGSPTFAHTVESVIRAMSHVVKQYPHSKLIIAGRLRAGNGIFDCSRSRLEEVAASVGLSRIQFLPPYTQQEAPEVYALGDLQVHMMHLDWTPNTVAEGMACGLPVLHTGNGGVPEIVGDGGLSMGLPNDWEEIRVARPIDIAEKIMELYHQRLATGEAAREVAKEKFDIKVWVEKHERIFEDLLQA